MEFISELFINPIMQSMILGPIMGVVFAALCAGLTRSPTNQAPIKTNGVRLD
jgi:phosphate/sulfate permease